MKIELATAAHIDEVLTLHRKFHVASIRDEDKTDGFVTTSFTEEQLVELISKERGLFIATIDSKIVGYAMAASWNYWRRWPMFAHMIEKLSEFEFDGLRLSTSNSYQYGPICVDASVRGSGVLEALFSFSLRAMSKRFPILVTFINTINGRSYAAHTRKLGLTVLTTFEFNNNRYYWLVCKTER